MSDEIPQEIRDRIENENSDNDGTQDAADADNSGEGSDDNAPEPQTDDSANDSADDEPDEPSEDFGPSLLDQREEQGTESRYVTDEAYLIQDIGQSAFTATEAFIAAHKPLGLFRINMFGTPVAEEMISQAQAGYPQTFGEVLPSGKVKTEDGNVVAQLLNYNDNPVDPSHNNPGNVRLVTPGSSGLALTSRSNSRGLNLKGHFEDAMAQGDTTGIARIIQYIGFAFFDDVSVPEEIMTMSPGDDIDRNKLTFKAHSDKAKVLKQQLVTGGATEETTSKPSIEGIG